MIIPQYYQPAGLSPYLAFRCATLHNYHNPMLSSIYSAHVPAQPTTRKGVLPLSAYIISVYFSCLKITQS